MDIDFAAAARFLAALSPDKSETFQTFTDPEPKPKPDPLATYRHGSLQRLTPWLAQMQDKGAGVFVMVNRGDGKGRSAANVTGCRALFVDLDGSPIEPVLAAPIPPRITVESSPGRYHAYWPVVDFPLDQFTAAQKVLIALYSADKKIHDKPRVLRLPGFIHQKYEPFQSRLLTCHDAPLTWREMADAFGLAQRWTLPDTIPEGERNTVIYSLARSAAGKGVPEAEQARKALKVNTTRCAPPLPESEVLATVASAYKAPQTREVGMACATMDSDAYKALSDSARTLLLVAHRRQDNFGNFTLTWSECREWFPRKKTFLSVRAELVSSGLLIVTQAPVVAMPRKGRGPEPTFYRLGIGPKNATYSHTRIGPKSATPEALHAVAVRLEREALGDWGKNGEPKTARRQP